MHRKGLHVDNGVYYIDQNPHNVIGHYAALVVIDVDGLQRQYDSLCALPVAEATAGSPMLGKGRLERRVTILRPSPPPIRRTRTPSFRRSTAKAAGSGR